MKPSELAIKLQRTAPFLTLLSLNSRRVQLRPINKNCSLIYADLVPQVDAGRVGIPFISGVTMEVNRTGVDCARFLFAKQGMPMIVGVVVWGTAKEASMWAWLISILKVNAPSIAPSKKRPLPRRPKTLPWVGIIWFPSLIHLGAKKLSGLVDFIEAVAFTLIHRDLNRN